MGERFDGGVNATHDTISHYLRDNYTMSDGSQITRGDAAELMAKNQEEVDSAINMASHAYYPGDKIAEAESLVYIPDGEETDS